MDLIPAPSPLSPLTGLLLLLCLLRTDGQSEVGDGGMYRLRNVSNKKFLSADEEGIVGLRTGIVSTRPFSPTSPAQKWTFSWEPIAEEEHQGYWIQSRKDFLNAVTSYYVPGTSQALVNVWKLSFLEKGRWEVQNYRTEGCLQLAKNDRDVEEAECDRKSSRQHWNILPIIKHHVEDD